VICERCYAIVILQDARECKSADIMQRYARYSVQCERCVRVCAEGMSARDSERDSAQKIMMRAWR